MSPVAIFDILWRFLITIAILYLIRGVRIT